MPSKLEHARHNKKACEFLEKDGKFLDWVVTTAFYSAIHYVDQELFPDSFEDLDNGKIKRYSSLDELYHSFKRSGGELDKHSYRNRLVDEKCPEFCSDFKTLRDVCGTARYKNYIVEESLAKLCVQCLQNISEICEP